jgi:hypothetical protein
MLIRPYAGADRDAVNAVARAAFAQYAQDDEDWPGFIDGIGRMADLARDADLLVAEQDGAPASPWCRNACALRGTPARRPWACIRVR